ncbi:hypothetical protein BDW66DRAFT_140099 [Aspergillus desertorum]
MLNLRGLIRFTPRTIFLLALVTSHGYHCYLEWMLTSFSSYVPSFPPVSTQHEVKALNSPAELCCQNEHGSL